MKSLIIIATILVTSNVFANVECEKKDGRWYPKNETAIKIAETLGVKTCSGKKFKEVVKGLGETSNVVAAEKKATVEDAIASLKK